MNNKLKRVSPKLSDNHTSKGMIRRDGSYSMCKAKHRPLVFDSLLSPKRRTPAFLCQLQWSTDNKPPSKSLLTLSVRIPPPDGVQTLPSLPGPVSRRVKRNSFVAGSRLQTGWKKVVDWSKLGLPQDSPNISANQRQSFIFFKNHTRESFSL